MKRNENSKCIWKRNIMDKKTFDKGCFYKLGNVSAISKYDCLPILPYVQYIQNWGVWGGNTRKSVLLV